MAPLEEAAEEMVDEDIDEDDDAAGINEENNAIGSGADGPGQKRQRKQSAKARRRLEMQQQQQAAMQQMRQQADADEQFYERRSMQREQRRQLLGRWSRTRAPMAPMYLGRKHFLLTLTSDVEMQCQYHVSSPSSIQTLHLPQSKRLLLNYLADCNQLQASNQLLSEHFAAKALRAPAQPALTPQSEQATIPTTSAASDVPPVTGPILTASESSEASVPSASTSTAPKRFLPRIPRLGKK